MSIPYYPQPGPFVGNRQPYQQAEGTPPSGPVPDNPPVVGTKVSREILASWLPADPTPPRYSVVTSSGPAPSNPPRPQSLQTVLLSWDSVPYRLPENIRSVPASPASAVPQLSPNTTLLAIIAQTWEVPAPYVFAPNTVFINGPLPQNPPIIGSRVPIAVLNAWLPVDPTYIDYPTLVTSGPVPSNPPIIGARVPTAVVVAWLPPDPTQVLYPPLAKGLTAPSVPPVIGTRIPSAVMISWLPPDPTQVLYPLFTAGSVPNSPPPKDRTVERLIYATWNIDPPLPLTARFMPPLPAQANNPPLIGARIPLAVRLAWLEASYDIPTVFPRVVTNGPAPNNPPLLARSRNLVEQINAWEPTAPYVYRLPVSTPSVGIYFPLPMNGRVRRSARKRNRIIPGWGNGMTLAKRPFDPASPNEIEPFGFDFVDDLPVGDGLASVVSAVVFVKSNSPLPDPSAGSIVQSSPAPWISGTQALCMCAGWVSGVQYGLRIVVKTTLGAQIELMQYVPGDEPV